jgi:hypothetical protein
MISADELKLIEKVSLLLVGIYNQLLVINIQEPPEIKKVRNVIMNKDVKGFSSIRENLYKGFRRLDEMGVNDNIIDGLSSQLYLLVKDNAVFNKI